MSSSLSSCTLPVRSHPILLISSASAKALSVSLAMLRVVALDLPHFPLKHPGLRGWESEERKRLTCRATPGSPGKEQEWEDNAERICIICITNYIYIYIHNDTMIKSREGGVVSAKICHSSCLFITHHACC